MFARVSTILGKSGQLEQVANSIKDANPPGLEEIKNAYLLVDNKAGKLITITLWETREAVEKSMPVAKQVLEEAASTIGSSPDIEVFEVTDLLKV